MGTMRVVLAAGLAICAVLAVSAPQALAQSEDVLSVLKTLRGPNVAEAPRVVTDADGYITYLGAPHGNAFESGTATKSTAQSDAVAKGFVLEHAPAFGVLSSKVNFAPTRVHQTSARTYVKLQQTYEGLPVFGSGITVQVTPQGAIECVLSDIMRTADPLYSGQIPLVPTLSPLDAQNAAITVLQGEHPGLAFSATEPELAIYDPEVISSVGTVKLVWDLIVSSDLNSGDKPVVERVLVDAHGGGVVVRYSLVHEALQRAIYNANNVVGDLTGTLARQEGDGPTGDVDVDSVYDYFGDTYDFYFNTHGRDSLNDAGMAIIGTVRVCLDAFDCPMQNAFWLGGANEMFFGEGVVADDVVGHELTHGVTDFTSDLIYMNESGALNESFSDVWGEFIDLTNGKGTDTPAVRWYMGEDLTGPLRNLRNMKNPPEKNDPDTYKGTHWYFGTGDNGGVHINSGVSNKLCYLLTDGDTHNGFPVAGFGITRVAELYYECQVNLLTPGNNYFEFGQAMVQAANNLGFTPAEIDNVYRGLYATKIFQSEVEVLRDFRAQGATSSSNQIALSWKNPDPLVPLTGLTVVRRTDRFPEDASDGAVVGTLVSDEESAVDSGLTPGVDVYYGLFPMPGSAPVNIPLYARATPGIDIDYLTEAFSNGTDLSGTQITIAPVIDLGDAVASGEPGSYGNHTDYVATIATADASKALPAFDGSLPEDEEGSFTIPLTDDGAVSIFPPVPIPFFGDFNSVLQLSANGYISAKAISVYADPLAAIPTLERHFADRRISFLFSDLDPQSGGQVWGKVLDDKLVVTFQDVPSFDQSYAPGQGLANTVQCELFYNGTMRFTYLDLTVKRAVVGISDGRGRPLKAADILAGVPVPDFAPMTDFTALSAPLALELLPIPILFENVSNTVTFTAEALSSVGAVTYSLEDEPTGATINGSTGEFSWDTTGFTEGVYSFTVCAEAGGYVACQIVNVYLSFAAIRPTASDVTIVPEEPRDSDVLSVSYTYSHPVLPEGTSVYLWFRNGALVPAYTGLTSVAPVATHPGDTWYFTVMPTTSFAGYDYYGNPIYYRGDAAQSNPVTILADVKTDANKDGKVNSADLQVVVGSILGVPLGETDADVNSDGNTDVSDVQVIVNTILSGGE